MKPLTPHEIKQFKIEREAAKWRRLMRELFNDENLFKEVVKK